jgi:hypothetical protein
LHHPDIRQNRNVSELTSILTNCNGRVVVKPPKRRGFSFFAFHFELIFKARLKKRAPHRRSGGEKNGQERANPHVSAAIKCLSEK